MEGTLFLKQTNWLMEAQTDVSSGVLLQEGLGLSASQGSSSSKSDGSEAFDLPVDCI